MGGKIAVPFLASGSVVRFRVPEGMPGLDPEEVSRASSSSTGLALANVPT